MLGLIVLPTKKVGWLSVTVMGKSVTDRLQLLVSMELKKDVVEKVVSVNEKVLRAVVGGVNMLLAEKVILVPALTLDAKNDEKR